MNDSEIRKFLIAAKNSYKNTAKLCLEKNNAVMINKMTGCLHLFVDSSEYVALNPKQIKTNADLFEETL